MEGDTMYATCSAGDSRPVSNITWMFGNEVIRSDKVDNSPIHSEWRFTYSQQYISQTISRIVQVEDNSKILSCIVQNLAIDTLGGVYAKSAIISVKGEYNTYIKYYLCV